MVLTKNSLTQLDVFFWNQDFQNIHRPTISFLKINNFKEIKPVFHIGFKENMGYLNSYELISGIMVFEVLEGYPLQSLLFSNNENKENVDDLKFDLTELNPMDFYCLQEHGEDPYGDFILKNVKFYSTNMEQGIQEPGRRLVANFIASKKINFKIPYFYNNLISDNYEYHIIRNKSEIEDIVKDITKFSGVYADEIEINNELDLRFKMSLRFPPSTELGHSNLETLFLKKWESFQKEYIKKLNTNLKRYQEIMDIQNFIKEFYTWKNAYELEKIQNNTALKEILKYGQNEVGNV